MYSDSLWARQKNYELVCQLCEKRYDYCGLDTRNVKLMLNKLMKTDPVAEVYRYVLEAEDYSIKAKDSWGKYKDKNYELKSDFIMKAIQVCRQHKFSFGIECATAPNTNVNTIVYFDLPGCEQISFHTFIETKKRKSMPKYRKEWDGLINSTLDKLERAISNRYPKEIEAKIKKLKKAS